MFILTVNYLVKKKNYKQTEYLYDTISVCDKYHDIGCLICFLGLCVWCGRPWIYYVQSRWQISKYGL